MTNKDKNLFDSVTNVSPPPDEEMNNSSRSGKVFFLTVSLSVIISMTVIIVPVICIIKRRREGEKNEGVQMRTNEITALQAFTARAMLVRSISGREFGRIRKLRNDLKQNAEF